MSSASSASGMAVSAICFSAAAVVASCMGHHFGSGLPLCCCGHQTRHITTPAASQPRLLFCPMLHPSPPHQQER